jgi:hypothetical protein
MLGLGPAAKLPVRDGYFTQHKLESGRVCWLLRSSVPC